MHYLIVAITMKWYFCAVIFTPKGEVLDTKAYYHARREYRRAKRAERKLARYGKSDVH